MFIFGNIANLAGIKTKDRSIPMKPQAIKRSDLKPGLKFKHLGTVYQVESFNARSDTVTVTNPDTGYIGKIPFPIIRRNGRKEPLK